MTIALPVYVFLFAIISGPLIAKAENEAVHVASDKAKATKAKKTVKRPGDYSRYRAAMVEICELIAKDNRNELIYNILLKLSEKDPNCIDCRPFFNIFSIACKPKVVIVETPKARPTPAEEGAEEDLEPPTPEPEPTKAALQRLPTVVLIDRIVRLSERLSLDEKLNRQTIEAIDRLLLALRASEGRTLGEQEYLGILADYFEYAWEGLRRTMAQEARKQAAEEALAESTGATGFREQGNSSLPTTEGLFD